MTIPPRANHSPNNKLPTHRQDINYNSSTYTPCGSPPRFRERSPLKPHRAYKAPRSISPGGTPASSPCLRRSSSPEQVVNRVHWASTLEVSVITRPKTCREDIPRLFYSRADEKRFRREVDLIDAPKTTQTCSRKDYAISKAVVVFGDTTKTYDRNVWSALNSCSVEANSKLDSFSFDDAAFWNGILTWS